MKKCIISLLICAFLLSTPPYIVKSNTKYSNQSFLCQQIDNNTCFLLIRSSSTQIRNISINGTSNQLPLAGNFTWNSTLVISVENYESGEELFVYDNHGFSEWFLNNFTYKVPVAENSILTIVSIGMYTWEHDSEIEYEFHYGTINNKTNYYIEASSIQVYDDKIFVRCGFAQKEAIEIYNINKNPFEAIVVYTDNRGDISAFLGDVVNIEGSTDFYVYNDYLFLVRQGDMSGYPFEIYDISDVMNPYLVGFLNITGWDYCGVDVFVHDDYAIITSSSGIFTVNISNISNPEIAQDVIVSYETGEKRKSVLDNGILFVAGEYGVTIMNASDLSNLTMIDNVYLNRTIFDIYVADGMLFVATGFDGIFIYNVSDPNDANLISKIDLGDTRACEYDNGYLYVADGVAGFKIINVSDPHNPSILFENKTADQAVDVEYIDGNVFVSCRLAGLLQFNVTDKENPTIVNGIDYLEYTETEEYANMVVMQIYGSKNHVGMPGIALRAIGGDYRGYSIATSLTLTLFPVLIYNDTNEDVVFTQIPTQSGSNIYKYEGFKVKDVKMLLAENNEDATFKVNDPELVRMNDEYWVHLSLQIENISLISGSVDCSWTGDMDISDASGKANLTYHFYYYWNLTDVYIKIGVEIIPYNIIGIDSNFSLYTGFIIQTGYTSMGCVRASPINLTRSVLGKEMFSMMGAKVIMFDMNGNYSILRGSNLIECGDTNVSVIYPWSFYNYSVESIIIGANFHNVSEGDKILFDPYINVYGKLSFNTVSIKKPEEEQEKSETRTTNLLDFIIKNWFIIIPIIVAIPVSVLILLRKKKMLTQNQSTQ